MTTSEGTFEMRLTQAYLSELFPGLGRPTLFFRVFDGARLLADTRGTVTWRPSAHPANIRIFIDPENVPRDAVGPSPLVVRGQVADGVTGPIAEGIIEVYDRVLEPDGLRDVHVGSGRTDGSGRYHITYTPTAGKVKADLLVKAMDANERPVGQSDLICQAPATATVDIAVGEPWRGPSTHERLATKLKDVPLAGAGDEATQFIACSYDLPLSTVESVRRGATLARDYRISDELLFALASQGMPANLRTMLGVAPAQIKETAQRAVDSNEVSRRLAGTLDGDIDALREAVVAHVLRPSDDPARPSLGEVLGTGHTDATTHAAFLERFLRRSGNIEEFWAALSRDDTFAQNGAVEDLQFSLQLAVLTQVHLPLLRALTPLRRDGRLRELADLTTLDRDGWRRIVGTVSSNGAAAVPSHIPGATSLERTERYVDSIIEPLKEAFPGRYLRQSIARSPAIDMSLVRALRAANPDLDPLEPLPDALQWGRVAERDQTIARQTWQTLAAELRSYPELRRTELLDPAATTPFLNPTRAGVDRLLSNLSDPDLNTTQLDDAIAALGDSAYQGIAEPDRPAILRRAKAYQRIYRVAPRAEHVEALLGAGYHSAVAIARSSGRRFVRDLGPGLGGERVALRIFQTARHHAGVVQHAMTAARQVYVDPLPWAIGGAPGGADMMMKSGAINRPSPQPAVVGPGPVAKGPGPVLKGIADLPTLFGPLALCECQHCRSVYSPAAYLVDLMEFINPDYGPNPLKKLLARRPDLERTLLTCENTNTTLPYIDMVNEVLEAAVVKVSSGTNPSQDLPAYDSAGFSAEELRAVPQNVNQAAYDVVAAAVFPMSLPFDRPLATVRGYLGQLGLRRESLLETLRPGAEPWDGARVAEALGMSPHEYSVIAEPSQPVEAYFGGGNEDLTQAPVFLRRTGITFSDLVGLVKTWYVNRNQADPSARIALEAATECDPEHTTIVHLDQTALDRVHRFLRLWRRLGWQMADLDRALFALGATDLDATALRRLAQLDRVMSELRMPVEEAIALIAPIDTWGPDAYFLKLFANRGVDDMAAFALDYGVAGDPEIKPANQPFQVATPGALTGHVPAVLAALRVTGPDLELIREYLQLEADATLTLDVLSRLYRFALLARRLRLRIADLCSLLRLTGTDPFAPAEPTGVLTLIASLERIRRSRVSVEVLDYLYRHAMRPTRGPAPADEKVTGLLVSIRDARGKLNDDLVAKDDPTGDDLRARLGLAFDSGVVATAMAIVLGDESLMPPAAERATFLADHFGDFVAPDDPAGALLHPLPLSDDQRRANVDWVTKHLLPWLRDRLSRGIVVSSLATALGLAETLVKPLVEEHLAARVIAGAHVIDDFLTDDFLEVSDFGNQIAAVQGYRRDYEIAHKAALLIGGLGFTERELAHVLAHPASFDGFTIDGLPLDPVDDSVATDRLAAWARAADLVDLRRKLPDGERTLVDLFDAQVPANVDAVPHLLSVLAEVSGWDLAPLTDVASHLGVVEGDLRTEVGPRRLRDCLGLTWRSGVTPGVMFDWAQHIPDPAQAQSAVQAVKARYEAERWLEVATNLNDELREAQRTALVEYLVPRLAAQNVHVADDLFAYFLIDPGMQSCMLTSRIKQAISSVQLFVQRCLLNLEKGVEPDDIDTEQWTWRKNYRVWEANRKVFLYPENWIRYDLLTTKSPFFRQFETELLQNELTDEYVEQAYLNYLRRLDDVAHLDVRAMHWQEEKGEKFADRDIDRLHVIARTQTSPYRYFYRRFENRLEWTPWELVDLDIADAPHLLATVLNRRLQLFWSSFTLKPAATQPANNDPDADPPPPLVHWDITMGWSEYRQGAWSPKQISDVVPWPGQQSVVVLDPVDRFMMYVSRSADSFVLSLTRQVAKFSDWLIMRGAAAFWRVGGYGPMRGTAAPTPDEAYDYMAGLSWGGTDKSLAVPRQVGLNGMSYRLVTFAPTELRFASPAFDDGLVLTTVPSSRLLHPGGLEDLILQPLSEQGPGDAARGFYPFFLADNRRTYFAYPVEGMLAWHIPARQSPSIPIWVGDVVATTKPGPIDPGGPVFEPIIDAEAVFAASASAAGPFDTALVSTAASTPDEKTLQFMSGSPMLTATQLTPAQTMQLRSGQLGPASGVDSGVVATDLLPSTDNVAVNLVTLRARLLKFVTFQHPHVPAFIKALNRDGIPGLLTIENQRLTHDVDGNLFEKTYHPSDKVAKARPKSDVDFEPDGAYSVYNWELFFYAPMLIAERLLAEQRYEQARRWLQYVFDPTTNAPGETPRRFWRFRPFFDNDEYARVQEMLDLLSYTGHDPDIVDRKKTYERQVDEWLAHPFQPHRIARLRLAAYQKNVFFSFVTYCFEQGDALFRRDTIESINEATQLYLLASSLLGPRPQRVPAMSSTKPMTYHDLQAAKFDVLSNAVVPMENVLFPYALPNTSEVGASGVEQILDIGLTLYFCAPNNDEIFGLWDRVEDRLFKIRNCMNIEGVVRSLALFEPPIDPAALVRAAAAGADLDSVLGDLFAPLPPYRFTVLLARANEMVAEVKALGAQVLAALEKKDAEQLAHIHAVQEQALLGAIKATRLQQIDEAASAKAALEKQRKVTEERHTFYANIQKTIAKEDDQLDQLETAQTFHELGDFTESVVGSIRAALPEITVGTSGTMGSPVATFKWGDANWSAAGQAVAHSFAWRSGYHSYQANKASIVAGHDRRWEDWKLQERLAALELKQIDQQIHAADLRLQIATKELASHEVQLENSAFTEEFLRTKYTNSDLYGWMLGQLSAVYFQAYKLAYDLAKRPERAYRFERGLDASNFIQFGYWDSLHKGLLAGERLALDLKRLEAAYYDGNRREYELSRRVSLALHDATALIALKATGECEVELPEELFDADHPGHYFRRIKSVSLTIPSITGPYTNVNCTLTLLNNRVRVSSSAAKPYRGEVPDDARFRNDFVPIQSIATSHGQNDTGMFELNFRDERYLPFEGAGVMSRWRIQLPPENNAWDLDTVSDVILKIDYTAREGGGLLRDVARESLQDALVVPAGEDGALAPPLQRLFSARHEFPGAWHRFLHPDQPGGMHQLTLPITAEHYPYSVRGRNLELTTLDLFLWTGSLDAPVPVAVTMPDGSAVVTPDPLAFASPGPADPMPVPQLVVSDLSTDQATGTWGVQVPAGQLPDGIDDLILIFTYRVLP
jgi:hypothetical protein